MEDAIPDGMFARTSLESTLAIMREINRITFQRDALEFFRRHARGVVEELKRQGVTFPAPERS